MLCEVFIVDQALIESHLGAHLKGVRTLRNHWAMTSTRSQRSPRTRGPFAQVCFVPERFLESTRAGGGECPSTGEPGFWGVTAFQSSSGGLVKRGARQVKGGIREKGQFLNSTWRRFIQALAACPQVSLEHLRS